MYCMGGKLFLSLSFSLFYLVIEKISNSNCMYFYMPAQSMKII